MPIHWGTKGFSLNAEIDGTHVAICFGYPPSSVFKQSIYTALMGCHGIKAKSLVPEQIVQSLLSEAETTGLFRPAERELKCLVDRELTPSEVETFVAWCVLVDEAINKHGLNA